MPIPEIVLPIPRPETLTSCYTNQELNQLFCKTVEFIPTNPSQRWCKVATHPVRLLIQNDYKTSSIFVEGLIESNTTLREWRGNPIQASKICNPRRGLQSHGCCKSWTQEWDSLVPPSMWRIDYFSHSCLKACKRHIKHTLQTTFLDCLVLMFCDLILDLLPEWACLTLMDGTKFWLTSNLADKPVSRVRIFFSHSIIHLPMPGGA